ncbi:MFS transporter [Parahaliea mediterranea]|uniref:MFS transporter n=1 Tax=Parahaliea mediterranea TaxID=651086 RepID=UPI000E2F6B7E|nr:MFS transporter [Parahaliea mediterranea]
MPNNSAWPWIQVAVAFLMHATGAGVLSYSYSVIAIPLAEAYAPSRMVLMLGLTCMTLGAGVISPAAGIAVDRYSLRNILIAALLITAVGFVGLSLTRAMWQVPLIYGLCLSAGYTLLGPLCASTLLARWFTTNRGIALGIAAAGTSFGGFFYPPFIQWLADTVGWRDGLRVIAVCIASMAVPVWLLIVDRPQQKGYVPPEEKGGGAQHTQGHFSSTHAIIRHRSFWLIALVVSVMFACFTATMGNLMPFVIETGASRDQGTRIIANIALAAIPGTLLFGWLADRCDVRLVLGGIIGLIATGIGCFWGVPDTWRLTLGSLVLGLGGGGMLPVWSALLAGTYGALNYGRVMGLMSPILLPLNLIMPPFTGWIRDVSGSYHWAFVLFAGLLMLSLVLIPLIRNAAPNQAGQHALA